MAFSRTEAYGSLGKEKPKDPSNGKEAYGSLGKKKPKDPFNGKERGRSSQGAEETEES